MSAHFMIRYYQLFSVELDVSCFSIIKLNSGSNAHRWVSNDANPELAPMPESGLSKSKLCHVLEPGCECCQHYDAIAFTTWSQLNIAGLPKLVLWYVLELGRTCTQEHGAKERNSVNQWRITSQIRLKFARLNIAIGGARLSEGFTV